MLHRAVISTLNRKISPYHLSLVKVASSNQIIAKLTVNAFRKHASFATGSRKLDGIISHHKFFSQGELNLNSVKNVYMRELSLEDVGRVVMVQGRVDRIVQGKYVVIKDKTGAVQLVANETRKDVKDLIEKIELDSFLGVIGIVREKPKDESKSKDVGVEDEFYIIVNKIISPEPYVNPYKKTKEVKKLKSFERGLKKLEKAELFVEGDKVNYYTTRSHNCGELCENHVGQNVQLMGWVAFIRMNCFIILQDKYGLVQLNVETMNEDLQKIFDDLSIGSVIAAEGIVSRRPPESRNKRMKTGEIEVNVTNITIINKTSTLPFYPKDPEPGLSKRLEYRHLDLRQGTLQTNLEFRCHILHQMRRFLIERLGFLEVETPTLCRRSPGGAQEFVVPTRKKGEFFALVQSPQQYKQLLMVGGIDKYFQIARCYRDEVAQKDRQPEFTQLDIEMSFCDREGVMNLIEDVVKFIWPKNLSSIAIPFPRMTYEEAMMSYGSDKPDTRLEWKIKDLTDVFKEAGKSCSKQINMETYMDFEDFSALSLVAQEGMIAYSHIKQIAEELALEENCKIFAFKLGTPEKLHTTLNKLFISPIPTAFMTLVEHAPNDVVILGFGRRSALLKLFGKLRTKSAEIIENEGRTVFDKSKPFNFLWVVDFPLFEKKDGVMYSVHHPFTQPHPDDAKLLDTDPLKVRGLHYDLVLNGTEIGGGSIRIHDPVLQKKVLGNILELDTSCFKHLLTALSHGAPVHGGFALGIDRFISLLLGRTSILDVIAFPKYSSGRDPITGAPTDISQEDKNLYHIN